eukprot:scaffold2549_cov333-Pavlova_lutheri.AAC.12
MAIADWSRDARGGRACGAEPGGRKEGPILDRTGSPPGETGRGRGEVPSYPHPPLGTHVSASCRTGSHEDRPWSPPHNNGRTRLGRPNEPTRLRWRGTDRSGPEETPGGGILRRKRTSSQKTTLAWPHPSRKVPACDEDLSAASIHPATFFPGLEGKIGRKGPCVAEDPGGGEPSIRTTVLRIVWLS